MLEGSLLFLEDINEPAYKIDRMLRALRHKGVLAKISGLLIGDMHDDSGKPKEYWDFILASIKENVKNIPVIRGLSIGHCTPNFTLPLGAEMSLDTHEGKLSLSENFFA